MLHGTEAFDISILGSSSTHNMISPGDLTWLVLVYLVLECLMMAG